MTSGLTKRSSALMSAILGLSLAFGCATGDKTTTQTANVRQDGPWAIQSKQRFLKHSLSFGGYQTSDIGAVWSRGGDSEIAIGKVAWETNEQQAPFHMDLTTPRGEVLQVALQSMSKRKSVSLAKFEMTSDFDGLITGTMTSRSGPVWDFEFQNLVPLLARRSNARGRIQLPTGNEITVAFTEDAVPQKSGIGRLIDRVSVAFVCDGHRVGCLDGYSKPSVWIDPETDEPTQHAIAASCAALIELSNQYRK